MKIATLLLSLLLVGCATKTVKQHYPLKPEEKLGWEMHQLKVQNMHNWHAEGRMAAKQGEKGGQAHFVWKHTPQHYDIDIFGPFGAGHVQIMGNKEVVRLTDNKSHHYTASTPEALFTRVAGWSIPISGMHYWIRGIPDPAQAVSHQRFGEKGRLALLIQNGWEISYERYEYHALIPLPTEMKFKNKETSVKLIVQSWDRYA